jgi:hypothetical protein
MGRRSREKKLRRAERDRESAALRGPQAIRNFGFEITTEAMVDGDPLPPDVEPIAEQLFAQCQEEPGIAIPKLEELVERNPGHATLKNWLATAYSAAGRPAEAHAMITRAIREHPDYLFAKLNYAETCLADGRADEIPVIFGGRTELNQVITGRNVFHITEFTAFYYVMARYAMATRDIVALERCVAKLKRGAPGSRMVEILMTQMAVDILGQVGELAKALPPVGPHRRAAPSTTLIR